MLIWVCPECGVGILPLPKETVDKSLAKYRGWETVDDQKLVKELKFKDFIECKIETPNNFCILLF